MKKIQFEGIVNGTKYDNVNDYNDAVSKAVESGEAFSASSSTKALEVSDNLLMTPGFSIKNHNKYLEENREKDPDDLKKELEENLKKIKEVVREYTPAELDAYFDAIEEARDTIEDDFKRLTTARKQGESVLDLIGRELQTNGLFKEFYNTLSEHVSNLPGIEKETEQKPTCPPEQTPTQQEESPIEKLFKLVFGD